MLSSELLGQVDLEYSALRIRMMREYGSARADGDSLRGRI